MTRWLGCAAVAVAMCMGCGGGPNEADPRLIASGGVGDGSINSRINVYVINSATDEPISGADVRIGDPDVTPLEGTTDSSGLFTIDDDSLDGPTTVTATASNYVPATWFGADGANVTIPLQPTSSATIPQATLSGSITDWSTLPTPSDANHVTIATAAYSRTAQFFDPENELDAPTAAMPCLITIASSMCDWQINARTGNVSVFANILDVDTKGTFTDLSDDTFAVIGFAYALDIEVVDGVNQSGIMLEMLDVGNLTNATVTFPAAPAGLPDVLGLVALDLADSGVMLMLLPFSPDADTYGIPDVTGPFADGTYQLLATARVNDTADSPATVSITQDISDPTDMTAPEWLATPTGLDEVAGELSFMPVDGASLHSVDIRTSNGTPEWNVTLLDGRTAFTLPALDPDPLPSGTLEYLVSAIALDVDLTDFSLDDAVQTVTAVSSEVTTFEN